jgi:hypothetical protein
MLNYNTRIFQLTLARVTQLDVINVSKLRAENPAPANLALIEAASFGQRRACWVRRCFRASVNKQPGRTRAIDVDAIYASQEAWRGSGLLSKELLENHAVALVDECKARSLRRKRIGGSGGMR